ncbi:DUF5590 domain-containing protein [Bacillus timonensis]|nr:DUF5590 domain-containing protein [Bacillus timonensis]
MIKKIIIFLIVVGIFGVGSFLSVYHSTLNPKFEKEEIAVEIAREKASIVTVDEVYTYYGSKEYQVVIGHNDKGENVIVWVPERKDKIVSRLNSQGVTKKSVLKKLYEERKPKKIKSVKLGIERNIPIWEVIYYDQNDRLTYYYSDFQTGNFLKRTTP